MTIDLHTHTAFSDGTDSPAQLMSAAVAAGLDTVAITDHDTTEGWAPAAAARPDQVVLVRGAEFSTHYRHESGRVSVHLLGYLFDPAAPVLLAEVARLQDDRLHRGMAIVDRLIAGGVPISRQQVLEIAGDAPVGRPHIGRALMAAGLVNSVTEAFEVYLAGNGPYYVDKADTQLFDAVALVRAAGGVPVLAHPRSRSAARATDAALLGRLADAGLAGVEADHPDHDAAARAELRAIAGPLGLIVTGSSDYHGTNKAIRIGQERSTAEALAAIVAASSGTTGLLGPGA
jgi:predicted metal-dependent phosphoesterase TrpH